MNNVKQCPKCGRTYRSARAAEGCPCEFVEAGAVLTTEGPRRYAIRFYGLAGSAVFAEKVPTGAYLKEYDPEAHDGQGSARWTEDLAEALIFDSADDAADLWRTIPKARPLRPDGRPNRPLTAFTVAIDPIEESPV